MDLSVTCDCGVMIQVKETMCGSVLACECGKSISVPRLSELRRNSGLMPVHISVSDRLLALSMDGLLPMENDCLSCSCPTESFLDCLVECERMFAKKSSYLSYFLQSLLVPWFVITLIRREYDNPEVHGRELVLKTPVRLCESCFSKTTMSKQKCIALLKKNESYGRLLTEYPNANIVWERTLARSKT